jgi:hypothetical protein
MFIRIFRSKYFLQYLLFFILAFALWIDVLINPVKINLALQSTGAAWLDKIFTGFPLITVILSIGLLMFQALVFNQIHDNHRLAERNQMLVAAFYILLMSSTPILVRPNIMIIVNFLMIILINTMLNILGKHEPYRQVFDAAFLVGIASLLYFPAAVFIVFIWLCFVVFQIFTWREWVISIFAFLIPYLFLGTYYFYTDDLLEVLRKYVTHFYEIKPIIVSTNTYAFIIWGLLTFLVLLVFSRMLKGIAESISDLRKKNRVVLFFLFMVAVSSVYSGENFRMHLSLAAIPVSAIFGTYFSQSKRMLLPEIITMLILMVIFAGKFMTLK